MSFPYTLNTGSLKRMFGTIQETSRPTKFTQKHIESLGYKSKGDRAIISILKFIKFLDNNGIPTEHYKQYKDKSRAAALLAKSVKEAYRGLFDVYSDAYRKDSETLKNWFSTRTNVGDKALSQTVNTFKVLCELADFESSIPIDSVSDIPEQKESEKAIRARMPSIENDIQPNIHINIQLALPEAENPEIYDKLFESLKKHLFKK